MNVTSVDFIGRWIATASDDKLEEKVAEYSTTGRDWSGRDAEMRLRLRMRCRNELAKRRLCGNKDTDTTS